MSPSIRRSVNVLCFILMAAPAFSQGADKQPKFPMTASTNVSQEVHVTALLIPPKNVYTIFGKAVGNEYAVILVRVANKSSDYSLIAHDIYIDYSKWLLAGCLPENSLTASYKSRKDSPPPTPQPGQSPGNLLDSEDEKATNPCQVSSMELRTIRQVAMEGQTHSPRNWTVRALHFISTLGTGLTVAGGLGPVLPRAVDAFSGSAIPAFEFLWPDDMINKINLLNDLSFTINAVVPKNSSRDFMAFFPIRRFIGGFLYAKFIQEPNLLFSPLQYRFDDKYDPFFSHLNKRLATIFADWKTLETSLTDAKVPTESIGSFLKKISSDPISINNLSLNSIRIVVNGQLLIESADVPASLTAYQFKNADGFKGPGVVEGSITGRFLDSGELKIANAADLGITKIERVAQGSNDNTLNFKLINQFISKQTSVILLE